MSKNKQSNDKRRWFQDVINSFSLLYARKCSHAPKFYNDHHDEKKTSFRQGQDFLNDPDLFCSFLSHKLSFKHTKKLSILEARLKVKEN